MADSASLGRHALDADLWYCEEGVFQLLGDGMDWPAGNVPVNLIEWIDSSTSGRERFHWSLK